MQMSKRAKLLTAGGALVVGGFLAGAAVAVTGSATAISDVAQGSEPGQDGRPDEQPLTGSTADRVRAAVEAAYPDATIERLETDSEGVYEAHIVTSAGEDLVVQVGEDFTITGTQSGGHGHRGGPGEEPLTGDTADRVRAAVQAEYPNATIERLETDSEGVYEAHILTSGGEPLVVQVDENFQITGVQSFETHGGGNSDGDGDAESEADGDAA